MPASSSLPDPEGPSLSGVDCRALTRFLEQSLDHGFRLAIVEAATQADRDGILAEVTSTIGPRLFAVAVDDLPGADTNLWAALREPFNTHAPRCLALWGLDSRSDPEWARQLNVQRDLFVSDFAVPWLLFIHPASRVALLQVAPDFCDFAILWLRDKSPPPTSTTSMVMGTQSSSLGSDSSIDHNPLLQQARVALDESRFDAARDALSRFDLQPSHDILDRVRRQLHGARLERHLGHLALAEALIRDARNTLELQPPTHETQSLAHRSDTELANTLAQSGRHGEAEMLMRRSLRQVEDAFGRDHRDYNMFLSNLAEVLNGQGKHAEAERMVRDAVAIQAKCSEHGLAHAASLNVLATTLIAQGKYVEAEQILRNALRGEVLASEGNPPFHGISLHNLAIVLFEQGRYLEAERALREALVLKGELLGREHPEYARSVLALALILSRQGRRAEAEPLLRTSIDLLERTLGREHPDYSTSLHNLADELSSRGKYAEAERMLREVVSLKERVPGREHPDYRAALETLAVALVNQGKYAEAEGILRESLSLLEKTLGHDHHRLCPTLANLAINVAHQGRTREAIRLLERALSIGQTLGPDHPEVLHMQKLLTQLQRRRRKYR